MSVHQCRISAGGNDACVKIHVCLEKVDGAGLAAFLMHAPVQVRYGLKLCFVRMRTGKLAAKCFQRRKNLHALRQFFDRGIGDTRTPRRRVIDKPFGFKDPQRLAHRGTADAERLG